MTDPGVRERLEMMDDAWWDGYTIARAELRAQVKMLDQFPWIDGPERRLMVAVDEVLALLVRGTE